MKPIYKRNQTFLLPLESLGAL